MTVYKRQSGKWCYEFVHQGQRHGRYDFGTKAEAREAEARERARLKRSLTSTTFLQIATMRLDTVKAYCTATHFSDNRTMLRRFMAWADTPIDQITQPMIRDRLMELQRELGANNANRCMVCLKATFSQAVRDGLLYRNPVVGLPQFPTTKAVKRIPSREDLAKVLLLALPLDRAYLVLVSETAARVGEINALTWEDCDLTQGMVRLWTRKKKGSHRTPRWVELTTRARKALEYAWQHRSKNSPWVFTNPRMKSEHPDHPERWRYLYRDKFLATLCRKAGVPKINFHELRHLTSSLLASRGASLVDIKELLGHTSIKTTDLYIHSLLGASVKADKRRRRGVMDLLEDE